MALDDSINITGRQQAFLQVALFDADLNQILQTYGYPPNWSRPNTFESLAHIILEQQVSLASALSALNKLKEKVTEISPENILLLTNDELKACYVSRQKTIYLRHLAECLINKSIALTELESLPDDEVRQKLKMVKGVGDWTVDVYLIFILKRQDVFPIGDLAAVNALKKVKKLDVMVTREEMIKLADQWRPYRSLATMLLWHYYLEEKGAAKTGLKKS